MRTNMLLFFCLTAMTVSAANYEVSSPNGKVKVTVNTDAAVKWSVDYDGRQVLLPSTIDIRMVQGKKTVGLGTVGKVAKCSVNSSFKNPFYKRLTVSDEYGQLLLYTTQKFTIEVRAYNDGAAYRLISKEKKAAQVVDETVGQESAIAIPSSPIMMKSRCQRCTPIRWPSPRWLSACRAA